MSEAIKPISACFRCDGEGQVCDVCGEAPDACGCDDPPTSDCPDCNGTGLGDNRTEDKP